jgi:hypothetical protein
VNHLGYKDSSGVTRKIGYRAPTPVDRDEVMYASNTRTEYIYGIILATACVHRYEQVGFLSPILTLRGSNLIG